MHIHVSVRVSTDQLAKPEILNIHPVKLPSLGIQAGGGKDFINP